MNKDWITKTVAAALHCWPNLLSQLNIAVPAHHKHGPCPHCGGKDRFRFDDLEGRGTWICNQCGAGDGLQLVKLVYGCSSYEAAQKVADYLGLVKAQPTVSQSQSAFSKLQQRVEHLLQQCVTTQSPYLANKGLAQFSYDFPVLGQTKISCDGIDFGAGTTVCAFQNSIQQRTGVQLISPNGEKRLIKGSVLKGSYIVLQHASTAVPEQIIIAEGVATGLAVVELMQDPELQIVAAVSANNIVRVALVLQQSYPNAKMIIAADNDLRLDGSDNAGKRCAEKAASMVNGRVSLPPTEHKADWDDYLRQVGQAQAKTDFLNSLYQPKLAAAIESPKGLPIRCGSDGYDIQQDYLIKGYLPSHALACIYGPSGSYKSFLAIDWACRVATGSHWIDRRVAQGTVIYVVGEGCIGVPRRIKAWEKHYYRDQPIQNLFRIDCPVFPASPESLAQLQQAIQLIQAHSAYPIRLIVLDTLARCFGGSDENAAKDMGAFIQGCDILKAITQATILLVHHSGKDQDKGARGSSALKAALDTEFNVRRENEPHDNKSHAFILTCTKMKDAEEPSKNAYDLTPVPLYYDDDNELISSLTLLDSPRTAQESGIEQYPELKGIPNLTNNHIALWQCIRQRTQEHDSCSKALIRDDLRAMGLAVDKKFGRWLEKLEGNGIIAVEGDVIISFGKR